MNSDRDTVSTRRRGGATGRACRRASPIDGNHPRPERSVLGGDGVQQSRESLPAVEGRDHDVDVGPSGHRTRPPRASRSARSAPPTRAASSSIDFTAGARCRQPAANLGSSMNRCSTSASAAGEKASYVNPFTPSVDELRDAAHPGADDGDPVHERFVDDERRVLGPQRRDDEHVETAVNSRQLARRTPPRTARAGRPPRASAGRGTPDRLAGPRRSTTSNGPLRRRAASTNTWAPLCQTIVPTKPIVTAALSIPRDLRRLCEAVVRDLDASLVPAEPDVLAGERGRRRDGQIDFIENFARARQTRRHLSRGRECARQPPRRSIGEHRHEPASHGRRSSDHPSTGCSGHRCSHHLRVEVRRSEAAAAATASIVVQTCDSATWTRCPPDAQTSV